MSPYALFGLPALPMSVYATQLDGTTGCVQPTDVLTQGNQILAAPLRGAGFTPGPIESGRGSGGHFARTRWTRGTQFVDLSFRQSLGMVTYGWHGESYDHRHVVGALGVVASYPGFGNDPLDGFRHLAADLEGSLAPVLLDNTSATLTRIRSWRPKKKLP